MSYFRIITNPKAVFLTTESIKENSITDDDAKTRLREMVDDTLKIALKMYQK